MAKKHTTTNAKLDNESKSAEELRAEWLRCLEERELTHKEHVEAKAALRKALDAWAEREISGPLGDDGHDRVCKRLLRSHKANAAKAELARSARDAEAKAWEAQGLPANRAPVVVDDDEQEAPPVSEAL